MTSKPTTQPRMWLYIVAILALCYIVGYGIGYLVGKVL